MHALLALLLFILMIHLAFRIVGDLIGCLGWAILILIVMAIVCH